MTYRLSIPPHVSEVIQHLPPDLKKSVKEALRALSKNPSLGHPLVRELEGLWKYRVRRYRIVYQTLSQKKVIRLYAVGHRSEIYDQLTTKDIF